ncbi:uncharacterized protein LTR77_007661 [Saxophila tyrrhenica]|uniref:Glycosyl hydrolase family 30 beta sandwich domain-containing protein n=1 Tax=Saxophila tyrrhenica TaxID=1690608 RepID=A0AAV9P631_9PEZI|nr:hypothetical protein LTR77_007661 [Saxophila tyrrhenica]
MLTKIAAAGLALAAFSRAATVSVDPHTEYQTYDGTGCSEAFQRSLLVHELAEDSRNEVLDYLFTEKGAGFTILRNGLGSSPNQPFDLMKSIAPKAPASNDSELNYIPLPRNDQYQVWLSKQAKARGVNYIYADAWSADGYMKTNDTDTYGGYLCGVYNATCESGDWRQAYADKIVHYIQDYADKGIKIDFVGFLNEPDLSTAYASMQSSGRQAADFIKVLAPTLEEAGLDTEIACCDGSGWEQQRERLTGIQRFHQAKNLGLVTSHGYSSYPGAPFQTKLRTWQTEWSTFDDLNYKWFTSEGFQSDGLTWANNIHNLFAVSNVTGHLYWWGAAEKNNTNEGLIYINTTTNEVNPTKRMWAHAHFGKKFIREGAVRIDASSGSASLNVTAFANTDGTTAVQVINNSDDAQHVALDLPDLKGCSVATYLTNEDNDLTEGTANLGKGGKKAKAMVPGRSLLSFYVSGGH